MYVEKYLDNVYCFVFKIKTNKYVMRIKLFEWEQEKIENNKWL